MSGGYLDYSGRADRLGGGARRIPVDTPSGPFSVWTKRVGNNPDLKVLLLHGGPGATHEYLEACDSFLPAAGIEYYYYDQLGSGFSDQPDDPSLWELDRFVDEVEQVRQALGLDRRNDVMMNIDTVCLCHRLTLRRCFFPAVTLSFRRTIAMAARRPSHR